MVVLLFLTDVFHLLYVSYMQLCLGSQNFASENFTIASDVEKRIFSVDILHNWWGKESLHICNKLRILLKVFSNNIRVVRPWIIVMQHLCNLLHWNVTYLYSDWFWRILSTSPQCPPVALVFANTLQFFPVEASTFEVDFSHGARAGDFEIALSFSLKIGKWSSPVSLINLERNCSYCCCNTNFCCSRRKLNMAAVTQY